MKPNVKNGILKNRYQSIWFQLFQSQIFSIFFFGGGGGGRDCLFYRAGRKLKHNKLKHKNSIDEENKPKQTKYTFI